VKKKGIYLLLLTTLALIACSREMPVTYGDGPVTVGFLAGDGTAMGISTRTSAGEDGLSTLWSPGDIIALWAKASNGTEVLNGQEFSVASLMGTSAFFTSTIPNQMPEGNYTYVASYPVPDKMENGYAYFTIPSIQDGTCSNGEDIMVSDQVVAREMKAIDWENYGHQEMQLGMNHLLHRMRFYITNTQSLGGESIKEITVTFPRNVAGQIAVDLENPEAGSIVSNGENTISVVLDEPLPVSTSSQRHYLNISILPTTFSTGEKMNVTLHTASKLATMEIPLKSRTFAAGHSTPVLLVPQNVMDAPRLYFTVNSNNLGEDINRIELTAPTGCTWGDTGSNVFTYNPGENIPVGRKFYVEFHNLSTFQAFSGQSIQVKYESEHVTINETVTVGSLTGVPSANLNLNVPYLLYENFSSVPTFSSNDEYKTSKAGTYSAHTFLNGWAGARCGAEAGKCIRIACRRETSARYAARVDSAPLNGTIKKATNLSVEFDYGANNQFGGIAIVTDGNVGQNCHIGYITTTSNYKSGDDDGTYESDNSFYVKEYSGSYDSTPNNDTYILHNVPATNVVRITWRTTIEDQAGLTNTTAWLYIDNIKIKISNQ